jgi:heme-degrading monooxygenase HmoA
LFQTYRTARQAASADGNLAMKLLRDRASTFWTCTSWASESAMKGFMHAKPHGPTHRAHKFPAPTIDKTRELRFK